MRTIYSVSTALVILLFVAACGSTTKEDKGEKTDKKTELANLKKESEAISKKIAALEQEIGAADTSAATKVKLVTAEALEPRSFKHYFDLQGVVSTDNHYIVTPRGGMAGQVKAVYVKEGDFIKKGQLLLKLDEGTLPQQLEQAKIQLNYLQDLYQRRKNLWDQKIGTEVDLITAKNNVANQQKQIDLLQEQLSYTNVYAENSGVAEAVNIRVGETFSAATAPVAGIQIVNPSSMKVQVNVPENYLPRVNKGTPVLIEIPDLNRTFNSSISLVSTVINPNSRTFIVEAKLPQAPNLKPNLVAITKLQDYAVSKTLVIPLRTIQTDQAGKFVYVLATENGKAVALKKPVEVGEIYGDEVEVKTGLASGDKLITQGYQGLYEGQLVTTAAK